MNVKRMTLEGDVFCKAVAAEALSLHAYVEVIATRWHSDGERIIVDVWKMSTLDVLRDRWYRAEYFVSVDGDDVVVKFHCWTDEERCCG